MNEKSKNGFFKTLWAEILNLLKNPKKLIPTFVLCAVWIAFSLMSGFGANIPILRFFYTITYSNGGMYGGFFGFVGGVFGKAVFAAIVNSIVLSLCAKKNPFSNLKNGFNGVFAGGLSAIAPILIGSGLGVILYWLFNITSSPVNCAVAVVAAVGALSALGRQNSFLFSLIFSVLRKFSDGKTPSFVAVSRVITGFSLGFALGFLMTFIRSPLTLFLVGLVLLIAGTVLLIVGKNTAKRIAATVALVMIVGASLLPVFTVNVSAAELPEGFVNPAETLDFGNGICNSLYDVKNTDAVIFGLFGAESWFVKHLYSTAFKGCGELGTLKISKIIPADYQPLTVYRNEKNDAVTVTGGAIISHPGYENGWEEHQYDLTYHYELELYDFVFNDGGILVDIRGTETYDYSVSGPHLNVKDNETFIIDDKGKLLYAYRDPDTGLLMMSLSIDDGHGGLVLVYSVDGILPATGNPGGDDDDYVPYRGRLTYTNGRKNKYGQPFPDLMDFDMDGEMTWADVAIQSELSHNPDYLDLPLSPVAIAMIALISAIVGSGGAVAGAAVASVVGSAAAEVLGAEVAETLGETVAETTVETTESVVSGIDDLGPHISRDEDGDLNVTDPATGEKRLYKNNGDGTYTNPLTGATYTEDELKSSLESREENADTIRQDTATAEEAIASQRDDNQGLSDYAKEYATEKAEQAERDEYIDKLSEKYGVTPGDEEALRQKIATAQGRAEIESYENAELESEFKDKQEYVETVEKVADTSIDVLADVTGRKDIKATYTMAKNTAARTSEAIAYDKNVAVGIAQGAIEGTISVVQDNVDGAGAKLVANVVGETYKDAMDATINGKDMTEAVVGGIGKGLVNTGVDVGMDLIGDGVKDAMGDVADEAIKNALTEGAEVTKGSIADGAKTLTGDLVKDTLDDSFTPPTKNNP